MTTPPKTNTGTTAPPAAVGSTNAADHADGLRTGGSHAAPTSTTLFDKGATGDADASKRLALAAKASLVDTKAPKKSGKDGAAADPKTSDTPSTAANPAAENPDNATSTRTHRAGAAVSDTARAKAAAEAKKELDSVTALQRSPVFRMINADPGDRQAFAKEKQDKQAKFEQAVALNVMTSGMSALGADPSVVQALDGGAKISVVDDSKVEADAAYDPKAGAILVKKSTIATLYDSAQKLQAANVTDGLGTVTDAVKADTSVVMDSVLRTGATIGAHEDTHLLQDKTGGIAASNAALGKQYSDLVAQAKDIKDPAERLKFLNDGSVKLEKARIQAEEYPAYNKQEREQRAVGVETHSRLTLDDSMRDLPVDAAVDNIYKLQAADEYHMVDGLLVTPALARSASATGDLGANGLDLAGMHFATNAISTDGTGMKAVLDKPIAGKSIADNGLFSVFATILGGQKIDGKFIPGKQVDGKFIPGHDVDGKFIPGKQVDGKFIPGQDVDGKFIPGQDVDGKFIPGKQVDGKFIPGADIDGKFIPGTDIGGKFIPGEQVDGKFIPGEQVDGKFIPGRQVDGKFIPGQDVGGKFIPGREIDGKFIPGQDVDGKFIPGTFIDGKFIPGSEVS